MKKLNCNNCDGENINVIGELSGSRLFKCDSCKFEFVDFNEIANAYSATSDSTVTSEDYIKRNISLYNTKKKDFDKLSKNQSEIFVKHIGKRSLKILEIGCGVAGRAEGYIADGHSYIGLDLDPRFVDFVNSRGIVAFNKDFLEYENGKYDVILCSQVIEHIKNLPFFIKKIKKTLNNGGVFHFDVPNNDSIVSTLYKKLKRVSRYGAIEMPHHLYGHGLQSMSALLSKEFDYVELMTRMPDDEFFGQATKLPLYWFPIKLIAQFMNRGSLLVGLASDKFIYLKLK